MKITAEGVIYAVNSAGEFVWFSSGKEQDNQGKDIEEVLVRDVDIEYLSDQIKIYSKNDLFFPMTQNIVIIKPKIFNRNNGLYTIAFCTLWGGDPCRNLLRIYFSKEVNKLAIAATESFMGRKYIKVDKDTWELRD
jgi:hypothetical protein